MIVGIAADHGGYELKQTIRQYLEKNRYEVIDFGAYKLDPADDYPDFVIPLAKSVSEGESERGIAVCGSGVGACIAANKVKGVRAALIHENFSAHQGVEDDDMNLICLGGRVIGENVALEIVRTFLDARFTGEERHKRRLKKIEALEKD
jgi:ribose 5-phosphate isomerase B